MLVIVQPYQDGLSYWCGAYWSTTRADAREYTPSELDAEMGWLTRQDTILARVVKCTQA